MIERLKRTVEFAKEENVPILHEEKAKWLEHFVNEKKPKRILELGCAIGYSASILASAGAKVVSVDLNNRELLMAEELTKSLNLDVSFVHQECVDFCKETSEQFDLIFIDFEKSKYTQIIPLIEKLVPAGWIIADNVLHPNCKQYLDEISVKYETELVEITDGLAVTFK